MATIVTRAGKGSPLTHVEVDANFTNLNTAKLESSNAGTSGQVLTSNGAGVTPSWTTVSGGGTVGLEQVFLLMGA